MLPPLPEVPATAMLPQLMDAGSVMGFPGPPGGGLKGKILNTLRKTLKKLTNPWWDRQTRYNHATVDFLQYLHAHVGLLTERLNEVTKVVAQEVAPGYQTTNARLNEALYDVHQLRRALAASQGVTSPDPEALGPPSGPTTPLDPVQVIEGLFLHTRLAPPPGRGLVVAPVGLHALDLASLGYQVVLSGSSWEPFHHPDLRVVNGKEPTTQPFPDGTFDFAVALSAEGEHTHGLGLVGDKVRSVRETVVKMLQPGARVIGSWAVKDAVPTRADLVEALKPLNVIEMVHAVRVGHGWSLRAEPDAEAELVLWVAVKD